MEPIRRGSRVREVWACWLLAAMGCGPPQVGTDLRAYRAMNQLHTAVASRRVDLVDRSMSEIDRLQKDGAFSPLAREELDRIAGAARSGQWDHARTKLRRFIRGQRPPAAP